MNGPFQIGIFLDRFKINLFNCNFLHRRILKALEDFTKRPFS